MDAASVGRWAPISFPGSKDFQTCMLLGNLVSDPPPKWLDDKLCVFIMCVCCVCWEYKHAYRSIFRFVSNSLSTSLQTMVEHTDTLMQQLDAYRGEEACTVVPRVITLYTRPHIPCSHCNMPANKYLETNIPKSVGCSTVEPLLSRQPWDRRKCPDGTGWKVHKHGIWGSTVCLLNCPYFKVIKEVPLVCLREV